MSPPLTLTYVKADLFSAPRGSILVHACNTVGFWGGAYCEEHGPNDILGTCLLILGSEEEGYDVACLFTSRFHGKRKDKPEQILKYTKDAVEDLMRKNVGRKELHAWLIKPHLYCESLPKADVIKFGVPWEETEKILKELEVTMTIYTPEVE
ncbi:hypothetical protein L218DRAFT_950127 [Marasmius fiardii PR-910]|nr:hypothetical protein L218DRAFT_950127 [Marasmius fiardii PR-910]